MAISVADYQVRNQLSDCDWEVSDTTTTLPYRDTLSGRVPGLRKLRFPFAGGEFVVEIEGEQPAWVEPTVRSLGGLLRLGPGWDSYGGRPVDPDCIAAAIDLAMRTLRDDSPVPSVVPTSRGGIQFEWHIHGVDLEIEFFNAARIRGYFEDERTGSTWERDLTFDVSPLVEAIARISLGA